jgi:hypothetical protein
MELNLDDDSDDALEDAISEGFLTKLKPGVFVAVLYDRKWFPAVVVKRHDDEIDVKFMEVKGDNKFRWPEKEDRLFVPITDALSVISEPVAVSKRHLALSKDDFNSVSLAYERLVE